LVAGCIRVAEDVKETIQSQRAVRVCF
jgi:hypothetical protein